MAEKKTGRSSNGNGHAALNKETLERAKLPLVAGGAALAGIAGGAALAGRNGGRHLLRGTSLAGGFSMPRPGGGSTAKTLGKAAKEVGRAGYRLGELTAEVRKVREQIK